MVEPLQEDFCPPDTKIAFILCRKVGLPGESAADIEVTMDLICDLDADDLSVHTAVLGLVRICTAKWSRKLGE
ncbi:MAG: hypothetical protein JKY17_02110 [Magnetovibrio sp.]|nr:hypothetical protein [Magnetovibrio sp.]